MRNLERNGIPASYCELSKNGGFVCAGNILVGCVKAGLAAADAPGVPYTNQFAFDQTSLTTIRVPSTAKTWTRVPAGMKAPSETTSTNLSPKRTTPEGRSGVLVVPMAPSSMAASSAPGSDGWVVDWSV